MFLEISQNSQENACLRVSFLITLQTRPAPLLTKRPWHRCFLVNFTKFLGTLFLKNTSRRRLLDIWNPWDWKYIICLFKFYRQKWRNSTWKFEVFIELMFRYFYQFNIFALNESEAWGLQFYEKRDSGTGVFL